MKRILLFSVMALVAMPLASSALTPKPGFFDDAMSSQEALDSLSSEQRSELSAYLASSALENPDTVMQIELPFVGTDKKSYVGGDTADVFISWRSEEAVAYAESRTEDDLEIPAIRMEVSLFDGNGISCSETVTRNVPVTDMDLKFYFDISKDCDNPSVSISISDRNGKDLGKWEITNPGTEIPVVEKENADSEDSFGSEAGGLSSESPLGRSFPRKAALLSASLLGALVLAGISAWWIVRNRK